MKIIKNVDLYKQTLQLLIKKFLKKPWLLHI